MGKKKQGVDRNSIQIHDVPADELAHYSKATCDLMYRFPHGTDELEGIANRTDFDLGSHTRQQDKLGISASVKPNRDTTARLAVQDLATNTWFVPFVIEPSAGVDRGVLAVLNESYEIEQLDNNNERTLLKLPPHLAPIKAAVIPLKRNHSEIVDTARTIVGELASLGLGRVIHENTGNIGKSYRKHDEAGTPICVTVDFQSLDDGSVTVRDRDTMEQIRIGRSELPSYLLEAIRM